MSIRYSEDLKKEVVKAYMAGDKSTILIAADYNIAKSTVSQWVNQYKEECLYTTSTSPESNEAKEIRRLNQLLNEKDKEIAFLSHCHFQLFTIHGEPLEILACYYKVADSPFIEIRDIACAVIPFGRNGKKEGLFRKA